MCRAGTKVTLMSVLVVGLVTSVAVGGISNVVLSVQASNTAGSGRFEVFFSQMTYNPTIQAYTWALSTPLTILDDVTFDPVATLNSATLMLRLNPQITMGFAVTAGDTETTFIIDSALLSFPTIPQSVAEGRASAGVTVTDAGGDGALLTGMGAGSTAYLAQFNGFVPGGTTFTNLITPLAAPPGGSNSASDADPPSGNRLVGADVSDMSARAWFRLSAHDLASGTSLYRIIPEPATLVLLLGGALVLRRRS